MHHILITHNMPPVKVYMSSFDADADYEDESGRRYTGANLINAGTRNNPGTGFISCIQNFRKGE